VILQLLTKRSRLGRFSFVGLVHNCLDAGGSLDDSFGPVRMWVNTQSAKEKVGSSPVSTVFGFGRIMSMVVCARINGDYKRNPFFSADSGKPIVMPKVLTLGEREQLRQCIRRSSGAASGRFDEGR
jgi:hypothetical protein